MKILLLTRLSKQSDLYHDTKHYQFAEMLANYLTVFDEHEVDIEISKPDSIEFNKYDLAISYMYPYILREKHFNLTKWGIANLHSSFLPFNRGAYPNCWSIIDQTFAGTTVHWIDSGIDTGNILAQRQVEISPLDTGETLYHRLERSMYWTFIDCWRDLEKSLLNGIKPIGTIQNDDYSSTHKKSEIELVDDLESYFGIQTAHEFINILRARTFQNYPSAYIKDSNGNKVYVRVQLSYE